MSNKLTEVIEDIGNCCPYLGVYIDQNLRHGFRVDSLKTHETGKYRTAVVYHGKGGTYTPIDFCPFCGAQTHTSVESN